MYLKYAWRNLVAAPAFSAIALLSIALGIGGNTAIFSLVHALLLRPLPYADAGRLTILWNRSPGLGITEDWFSTAQYFDIKASQSFETVGIAIGANYNLTGDGEAERVGTIRMSSALLRMLGARAQLGRLLTADDDVPGTTGMAVLGHGTWVRRYGSDPHVIGRSIVLNGALYQIAGVLESRFDIPREVMPTLGGAEHAEIILPLPLNPDAPTIRNREDYNVLATLKPRVSIGSAQAEMDVLTARLRREHPDIYPPGGGLTFSVVPLLEQVVGSARTSLLILMAAVASVLLIACANVANLLMSRAVGRQREIAVRLAIGATRVQIVRQLLTESILLSIIGGALGLFVAGLVIDGVRLWGIRSVPRLGEVQIDSVVLAFTMALSVFTGIVFGVAPALRLSKLQPHERLKDASRGSGAGAMWHRGHNFRRLLVMSELAAAAVVLIAAGLLVRSFSKVQQVAPGFDPANVLTFELTMTGRKYAEPQALLETYRQLWERLTHVPGVKAAGGITALPLSQMMAWGPIVVEGRTLPAGEKFINADIRVVGGDYFAAMGIPLLAGRLFNEHDTRSSPRVVLIDTQMARQLWPDEDPVGRRIRTGGMDARADSPWLTIVGIVGGVKQDRLDAASRIAVYHPQTQYFARAMTVTVRGGADVASLAAAVKQQVHALDADLPVYNVRTITDRIGASLAERRFAMVMLMMFAALAATLSLVGAYGVVSYLVNQGQRDLGIRMALGATPARITLDVLRQGAMLTVGGVGVGVAAALIATRFMRNLLFEIAPFDPMTFATIALLLVAVGVAACYIPARRIMAIDPMRSVRAE